ncbi:hypothetical protein [Embleya hyalina]|uniref:ATP-grasp ribosomal peptide maturase n=1 Tax=Embleya hyalina TaxID=516124 RepID=A0A401YYL9_9ACTN|nr:hypothetical protein [Embleya hyalina]GCD99719.1 ATP-grasp ribosomal peptide maturase [Embleya hyalina]
MTDPRPGVVVVAAENDFTADMVVDRLGSHAAVVLRLDPGRMREDPRVDGRFDPRGRWHTRLYHGDRSVILDEGCAVYWRKPTRPEAHPEADERWRAHENTTALLGLLKTAPLRVWVGDPTVGAAARLKPAQLAAAARAGFTVPDTLLTSDPDTVRAFVAEQRDRVVVKAQTQRHTTFIPTTRLRASDDATTVAGTVHYLQALVEDRAFDARVTVVDNRVFAAAITHDELDCRNAPVDHHEAITAPEHIARACVEHVRDLGLAYSALDFVVDQRRTWHYLETNVVGEFGAIETCTGLPISTAIARLLVHGPTTPPEPARM